MEEVFQVRVRTKPALSRLYPSERRYSARTVLGLAVVHMLLGGTSVLLGAMDIVLNDCWVYHHGAGIWLGVAALVAGLAGILASKRWYVDNNIRWFLVSSVLSGLIAVACIAATAVFLAINQEMYIQRQLSLLRRPPSPPAGLPPGERQVSLFEKLSLGNVPVTPATDVPLSFPATDRTLPSRTYDQILERFSTEKPHTMPETVRVDPIPYVFDTKPSEHSMLDTTRLHYTTSKLSPENLDVESITLNNDMEPNSTNAGLSTVLPEQTKIDSENFEGIFTTTVTKVDNVHNTQHEHGNVAYNVNTHENNNYLQPSKKIQNTGDTIRYSTDENANIDWKNTFNLTKSENNGNVLHLGGKIQNDNISNNESNVSELTTNGRIRRKVNIQSYLSERSGDTEVRNFSNETEDTDSEHAWHFGGNVRTVLCINIIVAGVLECLWSILSVTVAWKGTRNRYPEENKQAKTMAGGKPKKGKSRNKPDILRNHRERLGVSVIKLDGDLPTAENTMDYQERVQRYLESNGDASDNTGKKV